MTTVASRAASVVLALALGACSLTSKAPSVPIHLVTTEGLASPPAVVDQVPGERAIRIGKITSSAHLRRRVVYREADLQLGAYDDWRWTENPEEFLRRSIGRALHRQHGVGRSLDGSAPTLDLELVAFEEVRRGTGRSGRVRVLYSLHDEREVMVSGEVTVEAPARSARAGDVVAAIAAALEEASSRLAGEVVERLPPRASP
jgi:cholesterol transport system auxiliary component